MREKFMVKVTADLCSLEPAVLRLCMLMRQRTTVWKMRRLGRNW